MWYFDRMEKENPMERKSEYTAALDAVRSIVEAQRKWDFRNKLGNDMAGVLLAITPKFMLDNPEMFIIPDGMDAHKIRNEILYAGRQSKEVLSGIIQKLVDANLTYDRIFVGFLQEAKDEEFAELLSYAFLALDGLDFNIKRHPTLLYRAFIANTDRMMQRTGKIGGEHYTEPWIADLMSEILGIKNGDKVYDNACGMGILASVATVSTGAIPYVQDVVFQYAAVAHVLLLMIGKTEGLVGIGDSILDPSIHGNYGPFDKFLIDAPFGIKTTEFRELLEFPPMKRKTKWGEEFFTDPRNDQWIFIRQAFKVLSENGAGAALVNLSMLNRDGRQYRDTRADMIERGLVSAVIELPVGSRFYSSGKWSIVIFDRIHKHDNIFLLDLSAKEADQYFMRNKGRVELKYGESEKIAAIVKTRQEIEGVSKIVNASEVARNDYRLSIGGYIRVATNQEDALRAAAASWKRREELKKEFRRADEDLERLLGEYNGYLNRVAEDDSGLMEK